MTVFQKAFTSGAIVKSTTSPYGITLVRSHSFGKKGILEVGFYFEGGAAAAIPKITSVIPKTKGNL
jgi:hypothetical protein